MSKIIKYVSMQDTPVVINVPPVVVAHKVSPLVEEAADTEKQTEVDEIIACARKEAETIIADANQKAEIISATAEDNAQKHLSAAVQEAENLKNQAQDEGYQAGHQTGLLQGKEEARAQMQQAVADAAYKAGQIISTAENQAKEHVLAAEKQIIDIAIAVARKILSVEIEENPFVILPVVKAALEKVKDQEVVTIRVNPEDFDLVLQAKRDLQVSVGREQALTIQADNTITSGGCIIDTSNGSVDARLDTQLETMKKALQAVMT